MIERKWKGRIPLPFHIKGRLKLITLMNKYGNNEK
jgi:hypothetical protein